jgi:hypothetical protein
VRIPHNVVGAPNDDQSIQCRATKDDHVRQFHDHLAEQKFSRAVSFLQ